MGSRLSCFLCVKLLPMVQEVASAVADLDETVQVYCSKSTRRVGALEDGVSEAELMIIILTHNVTD